MSHSIPNTLGRNERYIKGIRETAARWFLRIKDTEPDHPERGRFEAWLLSDPIHSQEYLAVSSVWEDFNTTSGLEALANQVERKFSSDQRQKKESLRNIAKKTLHTIILLGVGVLALKGWQVWEAQPIYQIANLTPVGQIQKQELADGSNLVVNANTIIEVTYYRDKRVATLSQGEVIFDVAKDPQRPFIIDSGYAKVTVLGTHFVVNKLNDRVRVSVDHGAVRVQTQDLAGGEILEPIVLMNGEVAEVQLGEMPKRMNRSAADAFSFAKGSLVFDKANLEEIAETLSRYRHIPIRAITSRQHDPHVTAVIRIRDTEMFLNSLPKISPVKVEHSESQTLLISKK